MLMEKLEMAAEDMMEVAEETAKLDEDLDEMAEALSGSMTPEDLEQLKVKHRSDEARDILKAQDTAEDIMEAAGEETIALLTQEAVEHVDEDQKEREEEAKEAVEKKKEEKKEKAKKLEKEAMQQEMIENIKEHAAETQKTSADAKRAIARRERAEADSYGAEDAQRTIISEGASMENTKNAVNSEITNILNKLSLLSNDVKGSAVDSQI